MKRSIKEIGYSIEKDMAELKARMEPVEYIDIDKEELKDTLAKAEKVLSKVLKAKVKPDVKLPSVRKERLVKVSLVLRRNRDDMKGMERDEAELSLLLAGIKPRNMATQTFLFDPEGEKHREKLALLFLSKKMVVPLALVDYLNTNFVKDNVPHSRIGKSGKRT